MLSFKTIRQLKDYKSRGDQEKLGYKKGSS